MARFKAENFKVLNKDNTTVVYRTPDRDYNRLTFSITNKSAVDITLKGGAEPSTFGFIMSFISDSLDVISQLRVTPPAGWEATAVTVQTWVEWKIICQNDTQLAPGASLSIIIENILCENEKPGYFTVTNRNIPGYDNSGSLPPALFLSVLRPPIDPTKSNPVPFTAGYTNVVHPIANQVIHPNSKTFTENEAVPVYITYDGNALIRNGFKLILTNNSDKPIVLNTSAESDKPVVTVSFLFGEDDHDITTQSLGDRQITIGVTSDKWVPMGHTDGSPSWQFYPQLPQQIDGHKTIDFIIENIVTPVNVPDEKISLMYVQVNKFGDFDDRVFIFQLNKKKAKAVMNPLSADKTQINFGDDVKLTWSSSLAKRVTITYDDRDGNRILLDTAATDPDKRIDLDANGYKLLTKPTAETTQFEAVAYDTAAALITQRAQVTVVQKPADIKSFRVTPQFIVKGSKTKVTFSWEVEDAVQVILVTKAGNTDVTGTTSREIEIDSADDYKLQAYAYGTRLKSPEEKKLRIFTYKNEPYVALPLPADTKQSRPVIVMNSNPQFNRFYVSNNANNTIYEISTADGSIVRTYPGSVFSLLPDGTKLIVYNNKNLLFYDVATGKGYNVRGITFLISVQQMRFSPDGKKLFVSCNSIVRETSDEIIANDEHADIDLEGSYGRVYYYDVDAEHNRLTPGDASAGIGADAVSIAFNKDASMAYFTAYDYPNIFLVQSDGRLAGRTAPVPYKKGILLTENREADRIYAAFEDCNSIIVIDTFANAGCATIEVGEYPTAMVLSQDRSKLYVACIKANKVAVVDTSTNRVIKTYEGIDKPAALTLSQNGEILLVANYCTKSISMIDLKTGEAVNGVLSTGAANGNPFGISSIDTAEGCKVFVAKESYPQRIACTDTTRNTSLDVTVITIGKTAL